MLFESCIAFSLVAPSTAENGDFHSKSVIQLNFLIFPKKKMKRGNRERTLSKVCQKAWTVA